MDGILGAAFLLVVFLVNPKFAIHSIIVGLLIMLFVPR